MIDEAARVEGLLSWHESLCEDEPNSVLKLYRLMDLHEIALKTMIGCSILRTFPVSNAGMKTDWTKELASLARLVLRSFPRPSLGHWVQLARGLVPLMDEEGAARLLGSLASAERVLMKRNELAHGLCPDEPRAGVVLSGMSADVSQVVVSSRWFVATTQGRLEDLPLFDSDGAIYNSLYRRSGGDLTEYLDYRSGQRRRDDRDPHFLSWFASRAGLERAELPVVARSLLEGYVSRPWWESEIRRVLENHALLIILGEAGAGKSALLARFAEEEGQPSFFFRAAQRSSLSGRLPWISLYEHLRSFGADFPALDPEGGAESFEEAILSVTERNIAFKRPRVFVVDGVDELPAEEREVFRNLAMTCGFFTEKLVIGTRSRQLAGMLSALRLPSAALFLEPMDQAETREWLRNRGIPFPSIAVVERLHDTTNGNLLHLSCLPDPCSESGIEEFLASRPPALADLFERLIRGTSNAHPILDRIIALLGCVPDGIGVPFLRRHLSISEADARGLIDNLDALMRESADGSGRFVAFHALLYDHIRASRPDSVATERRLILARILEPGFADTLGLGSGLLRVFHEAGAYAELSEWIEKLAASSEILNPNPMRSERIGFLIDSAAFAIETRQEADLRTIETMTRFAAENFLVVAEFSWILRLQRLFESAVSLSYLLPPDLASWAGLCGLAAEYRSTTITSDVAESRFEEMLSGGEGRDVDFSLRAWDYRGLFLGRFGHLDEAIGCYDRSIELSETMGNELWLGYALMNRGKVRKRQGLLEKALEDIARASELRLKIATNADSLMHLKGDILSREHALLNASVGYLDLAEVATVAGDEKMRDASMKRAWNLHRQAWLADRRLAESRNGSGRVVAGIAEWAVDRGDPQMAANALSLLRLTYIPAADKELLARSKALLA